jgi:hypothetical protein
MVQIEAEELTVVFITKRTGSQTTRDILPDVLFFDLFDDSAVVQLHESRLVAFASSHYHF